jgi:hypothetical protein
MQSTNSLDFSSRSLSQLQTDYSKFYRFLGENNYTTQLHPKIVVIRCLAVLAMTGLSQLVFRSSVLRKPLLIVGMLMIAKIIFSSCRKDALVGLFKGEYPRIRINQGFNETICAAIRRLNWNQLVEPFYQGETKDGRKVFIARGLSTKKETPITVQSSHSPHYQYTSTSTVSVVTPSAQRLHVYIEGFNPTDAIPSSSLPTDYHYKRNSAKDSVLFYQPENYTVSFSNVFNDSHSYSQGQISCETTCSGTISDAEAFEILAQLDQRKSH